MADQRSVLVFHFVDRTFPRAHPAAETGTFKGGAGRRGADIHLLRRPKAHFAIGADVRQQTDAILRRNAVKTGGHHSRSNISAHISSNRAWQIDRCLPAYRQIFLPQKLRRRIHLAKAVILLKRHSDQRLYLPLCQQVQHCRIAGKYHRVDTFGHYLRRAAQFLHQ